MTANEYIEELKKLGYFEYVDSDKAKDIESSLIKHFTTDKSFLADFENVPPYQSIDPRFYSCGDGESLFKQGGVIEMIEEMKPFFDQIGFDINYTNDIYDENRHTLTVNNRDYLLAEGSILMWGETVAKYASMINYEMEIQKLCERIYIINNENHYFVFLTREQYQFLSSCIDNNFCPLTEDDWISRSTEEIYRLLSKE